MFETHERGWKNKTNFTFCEKKVVIFSKNIDNKKIRTKNCITIPKYCFNDIYLLLLSMQLGIIPRVITKIPQQWGPLYLWKILEDIITVRGNSTENSKLPAP